MEDRLSGWLALVEGGPGWEGVDGRARAVAQMRAARPAVVPLLAAKLADPDPDVRCRATTALLFVDAGRTLELVLPLLRDPDDVVRWHACGCLHDFGDDRAVGPLAAVLARDPDPQVRGTAAYALGGIGSPAAIPALLRALGDDERDLHGHSASSCTATALDDILGTYETRIKVGGGLCRMAEWPPDLDRLRRLAAALYSQWSGADAEPGAAPDTAR